MTTEDRSPGWDRRLEAACIKALGNGDSDAGRRKLKAIVEAITGREVKVED